MRCTPTQFFCVVALLLVSALRTPRANHAACGGENRCPRCAATAAFNGGQYAVAPFRCWKNSRKSPSATRIDTGGSRSRFAFARQRSRRGSPVRRRLRRPRRDPAIAAPKKGETREITIKELGNFDYDADKGGDIPEDVKALNGAKLRVRGFMIPMDQAENITQFAMVPDLFACCFGQPPQVQHTVVAALPEGQERLLFPG